MDFVIMGEDTLLQYVDEYTLYCHYLTFEPEIKVNYSSPFREGDEVPSFAIFPCKKPNREFMWKDSGAGSDSGDIFKLIKLIYGYTTHNQVIGRILYDFKLGVGIPPTERIVKNIPKIRPNADIRVRCRDFSSADLKWWGQFNISKSILERYRVSSLYCYWLNKAQKVPIFTSGPSFVYRVYDKYQLYFPLKPKGEKFRNDLLDEHVMGLSQLQPGSTLLITKSMKDVMCLRSFGYQAISPRSENVPLPAGAFEWLSARYPNIKVLFDNDMKHRGDWYPYEKIYVPIESGSKDVSDHTRDHSVTETTQMLKIITGWID